MSQNNTPDVGLRLGPDQKSMADINRFYRLVSEIQAVTKATTGDFAALQRLLRGNADLLRSYNQDLKDIQKLTKSFELTGMRRNGVSNYLQGQEFLSDRRTNRVARAGTSIGQEIALQKEGLALAKEGLRTYQQRSVAQKALNLDLNMSVSTVRKINSLEKARNLATSASIRLGGEVQQGNEKQARQAERILRLAEARVRMLERETKATQQAAKEEERRQRAINKARTGDAELEAARRQEKMRMLFGDGGATLFGVQAGLLANYMVMNQAQNAITGTARFSADLDESLRNLQAITVVTDENLEGLRETILDVSQETKFFATDIADAAVTLGQAGFSTEEIQDSIRAVALLATATGTDLAKSVDLATSILGVFNMESAQMSAVADTLTASVNQSKLNIDKLTLGLQYAGNTAAQSGVSFEELTASLGAMANAGIRSGSTLGTGMRQILIALQKPSGKFLETLDRLGLSLEDVDLRSNGLYGAMKNLKEGGFTAADAIRSFEVRAAAAFNALSGNLDQVVKLERSFLNSAAAAKANETQMRALSNQGRRLTANMQTVASIGFEPLSYAIRDVMMEAADLMEVLREYPGLLQAVTTGIAGAAVGFAAWRVTALVRGLSGVALNLLGMARGADAAAKATTGLAVATNLLRGPLGWIALIGLGAGAAAWASYTKEINKAQRATQRAQTNYDDLNGVTEKYGSQLEMVAGKIDELRHRQDQLNGDEKLLSLETLRVREQFREMGIELGENVSSVDTLIEALQSLHRQLSEDYTLSISRSVGALDTLIGANRDEANIIRGKLSPNSGQMSRWSTFGQGGLISDLQTLTDPRSSLETMYSSKGEIEARLKGLAANSTIPEIAKRQFRIELEGLLEEANKLIAKKRVDMNLRQELADTQRQQEVEQDLLNNRGVVERVTKFGSTIGVDMKNAVAGIDDPIEKYRLARAEAQKKAAERDKLIADLKAADFQTPEAMEEQINLVKNHYASTQRLLDGWQEAAQEAAELQAEAETTLAEIAVDKASTGLSKATTSDQALTMAQQLREARARQLEIDIEALKSELDYETDSPAYKAGLADLFNEYKNQQREDTKALKDQLVDINEFEIRKLKLEQGELERSLKTTTGDEERQAIRDQLAAMAVDIAERKKANLEVLYELGPELEIQLAEVDAELADFLGDLGQQNQDDMVVAAERDTEIAERLVKAAQDLAQTAVTAAEKVAAKQKLEAAVAAYMEARNKEAQTRIAAGEDPEISKEDAKFDISELKADVGRTVTRMDRPRRGGRRKDAVDFLIEDLRAKISAADALLDAGQQSSVQFDDVLAEAQKKIETITGRIATLEKKLNAGTLTVAEQKELNELVDQQAKLTTFIRQEEMRIGEILIRQGQVKDGILITMEAWSAENLNLSQTMQDGIVGTLSNAKSALTEFFTSWTDGTKNGKEAFRDLAVSVIKSLHQMFAQMLAVYALQRIMGLLFPGANIPQQSMPQILGGMLGGAKKAAGGAYVRGNSNRDTERYDLMPGEYVLRRSAVQAVGVDYLDKLNAMGNRTVAQSSNLNGAASKSSGEPSNQNIWLVDERAKAPVPGPNDIIAIINDDIARGGTTRRMITSVQSNRI